MATRIHWTEDERQQVIQKAVEVYHSGGVSHLGALQLGQRLVLHTVRLRTFATHSAARPELHALKEAYSKYLQEYRKPAKVVNHTSEVAGPLEPPVTLVHDLNVLSMDDLIAELAKRIAANLTAALHHEVKELEHQFAVKKHDPTYKSTSLFKKRITIIGLLGDQVHSIQREFGDKYAIKCIDTDRASGMTPPDADAYLLMKNFINHPLYHKYRGFPNHVLIDGGMSTLRMWLNTKGAEL